MFEPKGLAVRNISTAVTEISLLATVAFRQATSNVEVSGVVTEPANAIPNAADTWRVFRLSAARKLPRSDVHDNQFGIRTGYKCGRFTNPSPSKYLV